MLLLFKTYTMFDQYIFKLEMQVRDYELDYQGIVNNANYLHYLEHTRHEFCRQAGLSFGEMHTMGIDPVLARVNIEYKTPLRIGESFVSCLRLGRRGAAFIFYQDLFRLDGTPVLRAEVTVACVENGHLTRGERLLEAFGKYIEPAK